MAQNDQQLRSGFVALIGAPNAGKSTLLNRFVGAKVSIVTHKVQTTRALVRGIVIFNHTQIVFIDTPGIFSPKKQLDRAMVNTAKKSIKDADISVVLIDAQAGLTENNVNILESVKAIKKPKILILNKIDLVSPPCLLELTAQINDKISFERTFMVSALNGNGCTDIVEYISNSLPLGPWYYDEDQISDMPNRLLASEITREKFFLRLHDEIPYSSTIETVNWHEKKDGSVKIDQIIYVERESQKKIVLGARGQTLKAIGQASRQELSVLLNQKVHLFLFVKVRPNWTSDPDRYREMGLEFSTKN